MTFFLALETSCLPPFLMLVKLLIAFPHSLDCLVFISSLAFSWGCFEGRNHLHPSKIQLCALHLLCVHKIAKDRLELVTSSQAHPFKCANSQMLLPKKFPVGFTGRKEAGRAS
jgi:hypothetical protein